jgi:hypothetical protein
MLKKNLIILGAKVNIIGWNYKFDQSMRKEMFTLTIE